MIFPRDVLDAAGLDAEMRAIAERATSGAEQRDAQPSVGLDPMEDGATDIPQTDASDIWMDPIPDVPAGGGGGVGNVTGEGVTNGCFALVVQKDEYDAPVSCSFTNRYYNADNLTFEAHNLTLSEGNVFVALRVATDLSQSTPAATIVTYSTFADIQADQHERAYVVIPLYHLDSDFSILCDFRVAPLARAGEVI